MQKEQRAGFDASQIEPTAVKPEHDRGHMTGWHRHRWRADDRGSTMSGHRKAHVHANGVEPRIEV